MLRWIQSANPLTLIVYSDGSLPPNVAASYGFTIHRNNSTVRDGSGRLGPAEVFDAEATGALEGLKVALDLPGSATQDIIVCLDKLAGASCLRGTPSDSSQEVSLEFQTLAALHGVARVLWIPGYVNIPGNEQADTLAKAASSLAGNREPIPSLWR